MHNEKVYLAALKTHYTPHGVCTTYSFTSHWIIQLFHLIIIYLSSHTPSPSIGRMASYYHIPGKISFRGAVCCPHRIGAVVGSAFKIFCLLWMYILVVGDGGVVYSISRVVEFLLGTPVQCVLSVRGIECRFLRVKHVNGIRNGGLAWWRHCFCYCLWCGRQICAYMYNMSCSEVMYQAYYPYLYQRAGGAPPVSAHPVPRAGPFSSPFGAAHQYDRVCYIKNYYSTAYSRPFIYIPYPIKAV